MIFTYLTLPIFRAVTPVNHIPIPKIIIIGFSSNGSGINTTPNSPIYRYQCIDRA